MSVNLEKGQRVDLTKDRPSLHKLLIGLGWDTNHYDGESDFDLDASVFITGANGKVGSDRGFCVLWKPFKRNQERHPYR